MSGPPSSAGAPSRWAVAAVAHVDALSVGEPLDRSLRVTLNFHPDRSAGELLTIEALARDGVYRSQFETGTSAGGLTAHPGGDRWRWEQRIFGGAYDDAPAAERPKYGALNHRHRPLGAAPRFGSAHLRLREHVLDRATFCFPDSYLTPTDFGTAHRFDLIRLADEWDALDAVEPDGADRLDGYIEAQVHGVVDLAMDVEALVLDPCYAGTRVEDVAATLGIPVEWHEGRVLTLDELERHPDYRDPSAYAAARAIARHGRIDARIIGEASRAGGFEPQALKQVWHLTARFGA
ncbi:DUF3626 domain-containing protein [Calidifontibacter sp. DB0510]|uniref:DUF3626 domain-containing protein n=1 Tax=Metallococcus carri TaxID=1656884 RepID=A0A967B1Q3_9MICO|nr:DUF3626 domain-containing protein [Metallococcus carri]NOP38003.1 DUF3626 domain-containing protein [Calidifontibacter sp. DB2511S]